MFIIYEIQNTVTGFRYVGCSKNLKSRWKEHRRSLNSGRHHSQHLQNAWNKYGEVSFVFSIIVEYEDEITMFLEEKRLIQTGSNLYNVAEGGLGGNSSVGMSEDTLKIYRQNQSKAQFKRYQDPNERLKANSFINLSEEEYDSRIQVWSKVKKGSGNGRYKYNNPILQINPETNNIIKEWKDLCEVADAGFERRYVFACCENKPGYFTHKKYKWCWK